MSMDGIRSILVILDPTTQEPQPALVKGAALARALRADLELLACETRATAELREARRLRSGTGGSTPPLEDWLDGTARNSAVQDLEVSTAAIRGDPLHEALLQWIGKSPADLVIKDTHHHPLAHRTFLGNTDWHLIRDCPLPLLLTKPARWADRPLIAAAIDPRATDDAGTALEHRILECTVMLAAALKAQARVVHSYLPGLIVAAGRSVGASSMLSPAMLATEQALQRGRIQALLEHWGMRQLELIVEAGAAADFLPRYAAQSHTDLVVMGANSRSHLKQALIGSTAERVLEYLTCDVLLMKAPPLRDRPPF